MLGSLHGQLRQIRSLKHLLLHMSQYESLCIHGLTNDSRTRVNISSVLRMLESYSHDDNMTTFYLAIEAIHMNIGLFHTLIDQQTQQILLPGESQLPQDWTTTSLVTTYSTPLPKTTIITLRICCHSSRGPPLELRRSLEEQWRTFHARWRRFASWTVRVDGADRKLVEHRRAQCVRGATHDPSRGYLGEIRVRYTEATWSELFSDHLACARKDTVDVLLKRFHSDLHTLLDLVILKPAKDCNEQTLYAAIQVGTANCFTRTNCCVCYK